MTTHQTKMQRLIAELCSEKELATYLKIAEKTAYRFIAEGKIVGFKVSGPWRFRKSEVGRWIMEQESEERYNWR